MISLDTTGSVQWIPVSRVTVEQYEPRSLERAAFYLRLLQDNPDMETTPIFVQARGSCYVITEGHHRFIAHILAGRAWIAAVVLEEGSI